MRRASGMYISSSAGRCVGNSTITDINGINFDWANGTPELASALPVAILGAPISPARINVAQTATYNSRLTRTTTPTFISMAAIPILIISTRIDSAASSVTVHQRRIAYTSAFSMPKMRRQCRSVSLTVTRLTVNPDDTVGGSNSCTWSKVSDANDPVSLSDQFDGNPGGANWPAGQTCFLELRGYIDITGHTKPMLSFWDFWDLTSAPGATVQLQVGDYVSAGPGSPVDRTQLNWRTSIWGAGAVQTTTGHATKSICAQSRLP